MASSKKQNSRAVATTSTKKTNEKIENSPYALFPLSRYASLLGSQTLGLGFTLGMLPRTRVLQYELANLFGSHSEAPKTSQDHPQHPFFDPLTDSPARTLFWLCIGSLVLVSWSAGSLRIWHNASVMTQNEPRSRPVTSSDEKSSATAKAKPPPTPARILVCTFQQLIEHFVS